MSSNINRIYQKVINQNNTLHDLLTKSKSMPRELVVCQKKNRTNFNFSIERRSYVFKAGGGKAKSGAINTTANKI